MKFYAQLALTLLKSDSTRISLDNTRYSTEWKNSRSSNVVMLIVNIVTEVHLILQQQKTDNARSGAEFFFVTDNFFEKYRSVHEDFFFIRNQNLSWGRGSDEGFCLESKWSPFITVLTLSAPCFQIHNVVNIFWARYRLVSGMGSCRKDEKVQNIYLIWLRLSLDLYLWELFAHLYW